jgi:hypothetical protein
MLALLAVLVAFVGGAMASGDDARWWRMAAGLAVAVVALSLAVGHSPEHALGADLVAEARQGDLPAHITVSLQRDGARRQMRRLPLQQPVPGSGLALLLMAAAGLGGAFLSWKDAQGRRGALAAILPLAGGLFALAALAGAGGTAEGEAGVRAFLAQFSDLAALHVKQFTVPEGPWTFHAPGLVAVGFVSAMALVATITGVRPMPARGAHRFLAVGAALACAAAAWRIMQVGGLPWRSTELALWGTAIILGAGWNARAHAGRAASLVALAATIAALGVA